MTLSPQDFSLQFHPALSTDTAEYICLVNDRHSPEAIIDLLVQGKLRNFKWKCPQFLKQIHKISRCESASIVRFNYNQCFAYDCMSLSVIK